MLYKFRPLRCHLLQAPPCIQKNLFVTSQVLHVGVDDSHENLIHNLAVIYLILPLITILDLGVLQGFKLAKEILNIVRLLASLARKKVSGSVKLSAISKTGLCP